MKAFVWGKIIERYSYNFDGVQLDVVKYFATLYIDGNVQRGQYETKPSYHSEELHESFSSMDALLISWITYKHLGLNQRALASGICRALEI